MAQMANFSGEATTSPVIIGRASEIERLDSLLAQARNGKGVAVVISADPGLGKSRIARSVAASSSAEEFLVLQGRCLETTQDLPYGPVLDVLRSFFTGRSSEEIARYLGTTAGEIANIAPELATILPDLVPTPPLDPIRQKDRIFQELVRLFVRIAAVRPLFLVIEDLHWCDETSAEYLFSFTFRLANQPIFLLMTYAPALAPHHIKHLLLRLGRENKIHQLSLSPLTRDETEQMLKAIFELKRPVRPEFLESIFGLTEGNPAFIEETVKSLIAAGKTLFTEEGWDKRPGLTLPVPPAAREAARDQSLRLRPITRQLLNLAAVIGRRFNFAFLQDLVQRDEQELLQELKELIAAHLVVESASDEFSFRDVVTRRAIYAELLTRERKTLHLAIAEALERKAQGPNPVQVAELAFHYYDAQAWDKALVYSEQAGQQALDSSNPRSALRHYTRALAAAERLSHSPPLKVIRSRGLAYQTIGHFEFARADFELALKQTTAAQDMDAQVQALLDLGALWASRDHILAASYDEQAMELASKTTITSLNASSMNHVGNRLTCAEEPALAIDHHRKALALAERAQDTKSELDALKGLGLANYVLGNWADAVRHLQRAMDLAEQLGDRNSMVSSAALVLECRTEAVDDLPVQGEAALRTARQTAWRSGLAMSLLSLSSFLERTGDYSRALQFAQDGLNVAEEIEHRLWITASHFAQGIVLLDVFQCDRAREQLEQAHQLAKEIHSTFWIRQTAAFLAYTLILKQNLQEAESLLDATLADPVTHASTEVPAQTDGATGGEGQRLIGWAWAQLALARGDADLATETAVHSLQPDHPPESRSRMLLTLALGQANIASGRFLQAQQVILPALSIVLQQSHRALEWQLRIALGKALHGLGNQKGARAEYAAARAVIAGLGDSISDQNFRTSFLASANAQIPAYALRAQAKEMFDGLTPREIQVAGQVARGKTNREIADSLTISERTVKTHVANILSKLGFESRAQIARWATEKALTTKSHD